MAKKPRDRRDTGPARPASQAPAGAPAGTAQLTARPDAGKSYYPGQGFGLPAQGPGSVAAMPRRLLALLIDWLLSMLVAYWLTP